MNVTFPDTSAGDRECHAELVDRTRDAAANNGFERLFMFLAVAATITWLNAFQWYDDELESILESIGDALIFAQLPFESKKARSEDIRIACIRTSLADHGGNFGTQPLRTPSSNDYDDIGQQYLPLTNIQNDYFSCPDHKPMFKKFGLSIEQLGPDSSYAFRVDMLADWMKDVSIDRIVLFINPNEATTFTALAGLSFSPQVIFNYHDGQVFWLGRLLINDVHEYQAVHRELTMVHFTVEAEALVLLTSPIAPIHDNDWHESFKEGILSTSVDNSYKIQPKPGHKFLQTVEPILEKYFGAVDVPSIYDYIGDNEKEFVDMTVDLIQCQKQRVDAAKKRWGEFWKRCAAYITGSRLIDIVIDYLSEEWPDIFARLFEMGTHATFTSKPRLSINILLSHFPQQKLLFGLAQQIEFYLRRSEVARRIHQYRLLAILFRPMLYWSSESLIIRMVSTPSISAFSNSGPRKLSMGLTACIISQYLSVPD